jgi:hypothetical protein
MDLHSTMRSERQTWKRAAWGGAVKGGVFGLWVAAWTLSLLLMNKWIMTVWPEMLNLALNLDDVSGLARRTCGVDLPLIAVLPLACMLGFSLVGMISSALVFALQMDREHSSVHAGWWAARVLARSVGLWVIAGVYCWIVWTFYEPSRSLVFLWLYAPVLVWLALLPFGVLRRQVGDSRTGEGWWIPRWPGFRTAVAVLFLELVSVGLACGLDRLTGWPNHVLTAPTRAVIALLAFAMIAALFDTLNITELWMYRRCWLTWRSISAQMLLSCRISILVAWIAVPLVAMYIFHYASVPVIESFLSVNGSALPTPLVLFSWVSAVVDRCWTTAFLFLGFPSLLLAVCRCYALTVSAPLGSSRRSVCLEG